MNDKKQEAVDTTAIDLAMHELYSLIGFYEDAKEREEHIEQFIKMLKKG
jgi:hypothetical protein